MELYENYAFIVYRGVGNVVRTKDSYLKDKANGRRRRNYKGILENINNSITLEEALKIIYLSCHIMC